MNLRVLVPAILLAGLVQVSSYGQVTFDFQYNDAMGVGFNAAGQTGIDRRAALEAAGDIVESYFTNYNATIQIAVDGSVTDDGVLAGASANFNNPSFSAGFGNFGDVMHKILGGADRSSDPDGEIAWNFQDFTWDLDNSVGLSDFDFVSTAAHELFHTVGFSSDILQNGDDPFGNTPGDPGIWLPFDQFIADSSGALINSSTFEIDGARWDTASVGGTGSTPAMDGLYFIGANAVAANGGNPVPLYSPSVWEDGSSGSHLDDFFFTGSNQMLMNSATGTGPGVRSLSAIERGILIDIGYTNLTAVPEPTSVLLLLGAVGGLLVRRNRR